MTITPFIIYLWGCADGVRDVAHTASVATAVIGFVALFVRIACVSMDDEDTTRVSNALKWPTRILLTVMALAITARALVPDSKTIATMVVLPAIMESQPIQKDLPEIYEMAKTMLKERLTTKETAK